MSKFITKDPAFVNNTAWSGSYYPPNGMTYRIYIPASAITESAGVVSVKFYSRSDAPYNIGLAYIGHQGGASIYTFDGNQKKLTFGGNDSVTFLPTGTLSDEIEFSLTKSKAIVITLYLVSYSYAPYYSATGHSGTAVSGNTAASTSGPATGTLSNTVPFVRLIACTYKLAGSAYSLHSHTFLSGQKPVNITNGFGLPYDPTIKPICVTNSLNFDTVSMCVTNSLGSNADVMATNVFACQSPVFSTASPIGNAPMLLSMSMSDRVESPIFLTNEFSVHNGIVRSDMIMTHSFGSRSGLFLSNDFRETCTAPIFTTNEFLEHNARCEAACMVTHSFGSQSAMLLSNSLVGERLSSPVFLSNEIQEKTLHSAEIMATFDFDDPKPVIPTIPVTQPDGSVKDIYPNAAWDVLLDGKSVKDRISSLKFEHGEDATHNRVDISSSTRELFSETNPMNRERETRIEVRIGDRRMFYLLESNPGNEDEFSFSGRSLSARQESEYYKDWKYTTTKDHTAHELAELFAGGLPVDWRIIPSFIPKDTEFSGSPIQAIERLAEIQGAIVRCADDGAIIVRKKDETRPVYVPAANPVIDYSRINISKLDYSFQYGEHYTDVQVSGWQGEGEETPEMEEETPESPGENDLVCEKNKTTDTDTTASKERKVGDTVFIRVYWGGGKKPSRLMTYATSGGLSYAGCSSTTHKTRVEFKDYKGSVEKPISNLLSVEWVGASGNDPTWEKYSKELLLDESGPSIAIADVTYTSEYDRYALSGSNQEQVIAALIYGENSGFEPLTVKMREKSPQRSASAISDELIRADNVAIARGTAFLDDTSYDKKINSISAPYHPDIIDGVIVSLQNEFLEIMGNCKVTKVTTTIAPPEIFQDIEVVQCQPL